MQITGIQTTLTLWKGTQSKLSFYCSYLKAKPSEIILKESEVKSCEFSTIRLRRHSYEILLQRSLTFLVLFRVLFVWGFCLFCLCFCCVVFFLAGWFWVFFWLVGWGFFNTSQKLLKVILAQISHRHLHKGLLRVPITFNAEIQPLDHGMSDEPCGLPDDMLRKTKMDKQSNFPTTLTIINLNQNHGKLCALQIPPPCKNTLHFKSSTSLPLSF